MEIKSLTPEQSNKSGFSVNIGGMWEDTNWEIRFNNKVCFGGDIQPCPHCGPVQEEPTKWKTQFVICPRVVVATNEGRYNSTGVCLDCILEAAAMLPKA